MCTNSVLGHDLEQPKNAFNGFYCNFYCITFVQILQMNKRNHSCVKQGKATFVKIGSGLWLFNSRRHIPLLHNVYKLHSKQRFSTTNWVFAPTHVKEYAIKLNQQNPTTKLTSRLNLKGDIRLYNISTAEYPVVQVFKFSNYNKHRNGAFNFHCDIFILWFWGLVIYDNTTARLLIRNHHTKYGDITLLIILTIHFNL